MHRERLQKWNQIRSEWPDAPLKLFGAGADSGTFDYFTEAIVEKQNRPEATLLQARMTMYSFRG